MYINKDEELVKEALRELERGVAEIIDKERIETLFKNVSLVAHKFRIKSSITFKR